MAVRNAVSLFGKVLPGRRIFFDFLHGCWWEYICQWKLPEGNEKIETDMLTISLGHLFFKLGCQWLNRNIGPADRFCWGNHIAAGRCICHLSVVGGGCFFHFSIFGLRIIAVSRWWLGRLSLYRLRSRSSIYNCSSPFRSGSGDLYSETLAGDGESNLRFKLVGGHQLNHWRDHRIEIIDREVGAQEFQVVLQM